MAQITDYPISFPYGATDGTYYYTPTPSHPKTANWVNNFHRGTDVAITNSPIIIGDTQIGISGSTGAAAGPHCHVQAGTDQNAQAVIDSAPYVGKPGTVVQTGYGSQWGNFVVLHVDNVYVVYCHMSRIDVNVGTVIHAEDNVAIIQNADNWHSRCNKVMQRERGRDLAAGELDPWYGQDFLHYVEAVEDSTDADNWYNLGNLGRQAQTGNWQQQITDRNQWVADRDKTITDLTSKLNAANLTIAGYKTIASSQPAKTTTPTIQPLTDASSKVTYDTQTTYTVPKQMTLQKPTLFQKILYAFAKSYTNNKK